MDSVNKTIISVGVLGLFGIGAYFYYKKATKETEPQPDEKVAEATKKIQEMWRPKTADELAQLFQESYDKSGNTIPIQTVDLTIDDIDVSNQRGYNKDVVFANLEEMGFEKQNSWNGTTIILGSEVPTVFQMWKHKTSGQCVLTNHTVIGGAVMESVTVNCNTTL